MVQEAASTWVRYRHSIGSIDSIDSIDGIDSIEKRELTCVLCVLCCVMCDVCCVLCSVWWPKQQQDVGVSSRWWVLHENARGLPL